jgi:hypothetical protein
MCVQAESIFAKRQQIWEFITFFDNQLLSNLPMFLTPTRFDHDLALRLCHDADLSDTDRAVCFLVALSVVNNEPVAPHTADAFATILRTTAAS